MSMSSIRFDLTTDSYPEDFPKMVNPLEATPLSLISFRELIEQAQATHTPCYSVAVVCSGNTTNERFYHIYDSSYFNTLLHANKQEGLTESEIEDPCTRRLIKSIHYFVLNCFKFNFGETSGGLYQKVNLDNEVLEFKPLVIVNEEKRKLFLNSLNSNILLRDKSGSRDKQIVRRSQRLIAQWITNGTILQSIIQSEEERIAQTLIWTWCCSNPRPEHPSTPPQKPPALQAVSSLSPKTITVSFSAPKENLGSL